MAKLLPDMSDCVSQWRKTTSLISATRIDRDKLPKYMNHFSTGGSEGYWRYTEVSKFPKSSMMLSIPIPQTRTKSSLYTYLRICRSAHVVLLLKGVRALVPTRMLKVQKDFRIQGLSECWTNAPRYTDIMSWKASSVAALLMRPPYIGVEAVYHIM